MLSTRMPAPMRARHSSSRSARDAAASDGMIDAGWASPCAIDDRTIASRSAGSTPSSRSWRPVRRSRRREVDQFEVEEQRPAGGFVEEDLAPAEQVDPVDGSLGDVTELLPELIVLGVGEQLGE